MARDWVHVRVSKQTQERLRRLQEVFTSWERKESYMPMSGRHRKVSADRAIQKLMDSYGGL